MGWCFRSEGEESSLVETRESRQRLCRSPSYWETVHRYAIHMECENTAEFLPGQDVLEELHLIFLTADASG